MNRPKPKSEVYYRFRLFGWHIYISPRRLKLRDSEHGYSRTHKAARHARWAIAGHACEGCGCPLPKYGNIFRILPQGSPFRNEVENLRCLCPECLKQAQKQGGFHSRLAMEQKGGEL